jgi:hypothetical protein
VGQKVDYTLGMQDSAKQIDIKHKYDKIKAWLIMILGLLFLGAAAAVFLDLFAHFDGGMVSIPEDLGLNIIVMGVIAGPLLFIAGLGVYFNKL